MLQKIKIKVIPNAKLQKVKEENGLFKVYVNSPAINGQANEAVLKLLATHFKLKRNKVSLIQGEKSREKLIQLEMN